MMLSTREILLEYVSPLLGAIFANMMFAAPLKDVHMAVQNGSLGYLNPTPWAVMTGNTLGWITYSYLLNNHFIFWANAPGFIFSIWLNMAAAKLQYCDRLADNMRTKFVELVESKRQSIHQSIHPQMYKQSPYQRPNNRIVTILDTVQNGHEANTNEITGSANKDVTPSAIEIVSSLKPGSDRGDLKHAPKQMNDNAANNRNISIDAQNDSNHPRQYVNSHHILQNLVELGSMAKEISTGRMEAPAPHEKVVVGIILAWFIFISCVVFIPMNEDQRKFVIGIAVNVNMSFFYGAPLSIIWKVIKTKDSSWIHRQTMIMNSLCATFFLAFGVGRMDYFLIVPNGIGVILGGLQLCLRLVIPSSGKQGNGISSRPADQEDVAQNPFRRSMDIGNHAICSPMDSTKISITSELSA